MEYSTLEAQNKRKRLAVVKRMQDYRRRIYYDETKHDLVLKKDRNRKKVANKLAKDTEMNVDIQKRREKQKLKKRAQRAAKKQQTLNNDVVKQAEDKKERVKLCIIGLEETLI